MIDYKISAVVVTHNRLELLKECIDALRNQTRKLDEIIVVNNDSKDGTKEWLEEQKDVTKIHQENLGGAGGFHNGMKAAYEKGYDWIWCMDDDAEPQKSNLENLSKHFMSNISAVCPEVYSVENKKIIFHRGILSFNKIQKELFQIPIHYKLSEVVIDITFASFVGIIINRKAIDKVGLPNKFFFVHHDDVEYSIRLIKYGIILLVPKEIILHKEGNNEKLIKKNFLWKKSFRPQINDYWLTYYRLRNYFYIIKINFTSKRLLLLSIINALQLEGRRILMYDDYKLFRLKLLYRALIDAFSNKINLMPNDIKNIYLND